jgi:hypothetical protein
MAAVLRVTEMATTEFVQLNALASYCVHVTLRPACSSSRSPPQSGTLA